MKRSVLLTIVWFLMASVGYAQMTDDITETITAKEKEMYEAIKTGDMNTFEANLADEFMGVYATGISDRAKELENIKNLTIDSYEFSDVQVMQPTEGVVIIAYTLTSSGMWMDKAFDGQYHASSMWIETDTGEWKAVMHTDMEAESMDEDMPMEMEQGDY